ncbi:Cupredoxin [Saccharata proteae CBS 121410]|uniref:Cupredoxin n=1 Tax=Saccharata proteae CBS 121410 TaxID=1314787 RepID=A0A9P4HSQ6_9PEZI|nr:Cupredoxin [Saccharata proteae CBS 121410]
MLSPATTLLSLASLAVASPTWNHATSGSTPHCNVSAALPALDGKLPDRTPSNFNYSGNVRTFYVAAEEVEWNYVPSGWDNWLGVPIESSPRASSAGYLKSTGSWGLTWTKALYRGYTDASFTNLTEQPPTQGTQGPLLRAEVGDLVQILFCNKLSENYASMHSMGLTYSKQYEGSLYPSTTNGSSPTPNIGDAVPPGQCFVYKWFVSSTAAPASNDPVRMWSYHSFVNMPADMAAGLIGPMAIYQRGAMASTMKKHREFPILYQIYDETASFMSGINAAKLGNTTQNSLTPQTLSQPYSGNSTIWKPQLANFPPVSLDSTNAPTFHTLNGFMYANGPAFEMCEDEDVVWYAYGYGSESHVFHMHGNNFLYGGEWRASKDLNDGNMFALFMQPEMRGVWEVICHVNDHLMNGMVHNYVVYPREECPLEKLG